MLKRKWQNYNLIRQLADQILKNNILKRFKI